MRFITDQRESVKHEELIDNLVASRDQRELVTLALRGVSGEPSGVVVTGRIVALAEDYSNRRIVQAVIDREGQPSLTVGLSMIRDFHVGPRECSDVTEEEIHESHDPEPDGTRLYSGGRACRRCCKFIAFDGATYRVTAAGAAKCHPAPLGMRDSPTRT